MCGEECTLLIIRTRHINSQVECDEALSFPKIICRFYRTLHTRVKSYSKYIVADLLVLSIKSGTETQTYIYSL